MIEGNVLLPMDVVDEDWIFHEVFHVDQDASQVLSDVLVATLQRRVSGHCFQREGVEVHSMLNLLRASRGNDPGRVVVTVSDNFDELKFL